MAVETLSYCAEQVRSFDHDRFLTAIFAAPAVREHLFALYAFNIELAKVREVVTEPLIGQMRLQWWRDTLDRLYAGETVAHEVARPLEAAIRASGVARGAFDPLIDAREFDLEKSPPADLDALLAYAEGTGAPVLGIALQIGGGGAETAEIARRAGRGWALTGLLRAAPFHARQHRLYLPADRLAEAGVRVSRLFDLKPEPGFRDVVHAIGEQARADFAAARTLLGRLPRGGRSPALLIELGRIYLDDLEGAGWDPLVLEKKPPRRLLAARLALASLLKGY
jgi:NADH dehydrogenase [ubiquinone] 1 alpha subcomplex assembly factor 6